MVILKPFTLKKIQIFFATWYNGIVYLIPVEQCSGAEKTLRFIPPKNGQIKGITFAKDYVAKEVLKIL